MAVQHPHLKTRKFRVFKDQFDRKWSCTIDTVTNDPIDNLRPHGWKAPWTLPQDCIRLRHNEEDGSSRVDLMHGKRKADLRQAHKEWNERFMRVGYQRGGDDFDPANPSPAILYEVGPRPQPVEPVIASERGDPWILGRSPDMPAWARPFFIKALPDEAAFMQAAEDRVARLDGAAKYEDIEDVVDPLPPIPKAPARRKRSRPRRAAVRRTTEATAAA